MSNDDETNDIRTLIRRAADSVAVGSVPAPAESAGPRWRVRTTATLAVVAVAAAVAILVSAPWRDDDVILATEHPAATQPEPTVPPIPSLGTADITTSGMDGVRLPEIGDIVTALSVEVDNERVLPPRTTFTPPTGWTGGTGLVKSGGSSGGFVSGYATAADAPLGGRFVIAFYSSGGVTSAAGAPDTVLARDGTAWTVRTVDLVRRSVIAFSLPLDGYGALLFTGLTTQEWSRVLAAAPSADPSEALFSGSAPTDGHPTGGLPWLPADLAGQWRWTPKDARDFALEGRDGHRYLITHSVSDSPERLVQMAQAGSRMAPVPDGARIAELACAQRGPSLICGRNSTEGPHLTVWRDGVRIDVTESTTDTDPAPDPDLNAAFERLGEVVNHLGH